MICIDFKPRFKDFTLSLTLGIMPPEITPSLIKASTFGSSKFEITCLDASKTPSTSLIKINCSAFKAIASSEAAVSALTFQDSPFPKDIGLITGVQPPFHKSYIISGFTRTTSPTKPKSIFPSLFFTSKRAPSTPEIPIALPPLDKKKRTIFFVHMTRKSHFHHFHNLWSCHTQTLYKSRSFCQQSDVFVNIFTTTVHHTNFFIISRIGNHSPHKILQFLLINSQATTNFNNHFFHSKTLFQKNKKRKNQ